MPFNQEPGPRSSPPDSLFGLFEARDFVVSTGSTARTCNAAVIEQALWYFRDEVIAVPRAGLSVAGFTAGVTAKEDAARWATSHPMGAPIDYPPLIWVAAPTVLRGAHLSKDGTTVATGEGTRAFTVVPRIPLNRSYYDKASVAFLAQRPLSIRGHLDNGRFTARTIWPEDFRLEPAAPSRPIATTPLALRSLLREEAGGGARSPFAATALWERDPGARDWHGKPVLGVVLNGAQGDDDEAHGGHLALVTGRVGPNGAIGDWLANNFYTLDSFSEKGIIASMLPLDNYLADLNSGQAWYRPSYVLVAVLRHERAAAHIQGALARVYNQFYRHQLVYRHGSMNCASISVDLLRALGWNVAARGPTSHALAALSVPYFALRERSADKAVQIYDYFAEDRTRLFPAAAFEEIGADLLRFAKGAAGRALTPFEALVAEDLDALVFLRIPQLPSSRAWGDYPVVTTWEYHQRLPSDPAQQQVVPVPPRPLPERLRDPDLTPPPRARGEVAIRLWALLTIVGIPWLIWRWGGSRGGRPALAAEADVESAVEERRAHPK